ncbi:MAG: membrane protein insertase YidC [Desulfobacterales bacterium]|jgi:YidC/Oxa1 family membrane protein insertase|nr:membrane protein insertase YidC [Desulfobacterales bacterium]MDH3878696.1 membrane protein insertase YidC [Desulfobacterales bacterium]
MEQSRLLIAIVLSLAIFLAWQFFFSPDEAERRQAKKVESPAVEEKQAVKDTEKPYKEAIEKPAPTEESIVEETPLQEAASITVDTPLYQAKISENGAVFYSFQLKNYREKVQKDAPFKQILTGDETFGVGRLGFTGKSIAGLDKAVFTANLPSRQLEVNDSPRDLTFLWRSPDGIVIEKTYKFAPDTYAISMEVIIKNGSGRGIQDKLFVALYSNAPGDKRMYAFEGPSALINDELQEIKTKKLKDQNTFDGKIKWVALQSRYFMSGLIPDQIEEASLHLALKSDKFVAARYQQPEKEIQPGTQYTYKYQLFMGPKRIQELRNVGNDLQKVVDFGWFDIIAKPCLWLMNLFYSVIPNYGVAIIILTILVKLLLWPLGQKSYKSMSEMKKIQPLMKEIREKYKDDKQRMNQEVMGLYRTYKINPLGGCLPMVVQLPVFFALYRMLYEAIELRHAPFFLWIDDLAAPDRLFRFDFSIPFMEPPYGIPVLTVVMGASMLLQQKMSPPMGDATQAKMMMFMPIIFTVIFINFSSGLVLYWLVNNILSIAQQYYTQKKYA